jgi:hypothetical protein
MWGARAGGFPSRRSYTTIRDVTIAAFVARLILEPGKTPARSLRKRLESRRGRG